MTANKAWADAGEDSAMRTRRHYGSDDHRRGGELIFAIGAVALWTTLIVTTLSVIA